MHPFVAEADRPLAGHIDATWDIGAARLEPTPAQLEHGLALHRDAVALDGFGFLPLVWTAELVAQINALTDGHVGGREWHLRSTWLRQAAAGEDPHGPGGQAFRIALDASGLDGAVQTVGRATIPGMNRLEYDVHAMSTFHHLCHTMRDRIFHAGSAGELREGAGQGRYGIVWSMNSPPLPGRMLDAEDEFSWLKTFYYLGFRLVHLTYNRRNEVGDGGIENGGLSRLGQELIARMNDLGLIIDTPHSSRQTTLEAARLTTKPMMASHVGCDALFHHHRNKSDEEMRAIADTGGLVGIVGLPSFLGHNADINRLLDHVDHAVKVAGIEHVTIGTDNTSSVPWPADCRPHPKGSFSAQWAGGWTPQAMAASSDEARTGSLAWTNWPLFTVGLVKRGYRDQDIRRIIGGNLLRVLEANEPAKYRLQA
jgi:membrane dipeptidase